MKESGVLQETDESKQAKKDLNKAKDELAKAFEAETKDKDKDKFTLKEGGQIANAIATGISKGLGNLVRGFKTKSPYYFFSG